VSGDATNLTFDELAALRANVSGNGSFIDPRALRVVQATGFHDEWATAVLGRPYPGWNRVKPWEITLLANALAAEPNRPVPAAERIRREAFERAQTEYRQAEAQRETERRAAWHGLRVRLPVPVTVGHNWTMVHTGSHQSGREHIVVQADLRAGRFHRETQQVLCETPAKRTRRSARNGTDRDPLRGVDRSDDGQDRIPTCAACLRIADRIADLSEGP
jgi:hypothetical protein